MRVVWVGLLACASATFVGCGGSTHSVSGTVTFDNEPVREGHIAFVPEKGGKGASGPITDGRYSLAVPAGKVRVEINASKSMKLPPGQVGMDGAKEEVRSYIPDKYNVQSGLRAEIPSPAPLDFKLTSK
jgi:hypothetical protein